MRRSPMASSPGGAGEKLRYHAGVSHIPCLDGIRAVAALSVMGYHMFRDGGGPPLLAKLSIFGQTGVDLFFVLSGFLITRILLNSRESAGYFRSFYLRRAFRIFPLYFLFLVIFFFIAPIFRGESPPPFSRQVWSWFFMENVPQTFRRLATSGPDHYWSLAVEEHFYLVWPLLVWLAPPGRLARALLLSLFVAPFIRMAFVAHGLGVFFFTLTRYDGLAMGALLAALYSERTVGSRGVVIAARVLAAGLALALPVLFFRLSGSRAGWLQVVKNSLVPMIWASLFALCLFDPRAGLARRVMELSPLRWLGRISYGLYVFHLMVFEAVRHLPGLFPNLGARFVAGFTATILVAYLCFRFYETPFLKLGSRYRTAPPAA